MWFDLAGTLTKLGRLEAALQAANTALHVAPLDTAVTRLADVINEMGLALLGLGRPAEALAGFEFHCVQTEIAAAERAWLDAVRPPINLHVQRLRDFATLAALVTAMDVIVTIDTAIVHLAGALAVPVYLMLPFDPDWRWMLWCSRSRWYPTAWLSRQPARGAWGPAVIAELRLAIL